VRRTQNRHRFAGCQCSASSGRSAQHYDQASLDRLSGYRVLFATAGRMGSIPRWGSTLSPPQTAALLVT
jgi:hypothetical protein